MPLYELTARIVFKAKSLDAALDEGFDILRAPSISEGSISPTTDEGFFIRALAKGKPQAKTPKKKAAR